MCAVNDDLRSTFGSVHMSFPVFFHATDCCLLTCPGLPVRTLHHAHSHNLNQLSVFSVGDFCFSHSLSESLPKTHHCLSSLVFDHSLLLICFSVLLSTGIKNRCCLGSGLWQLQPSLFLRAWLTNGVFALRRRSAHLVSECFFFFVMGKPRSGGKG